MSDLFCSKARSQRCLIVYAFFSATLSFGQVGDWPASPSSHTYFGTTAISQTNGGNYAVLQSKSDGLTFVNSPLEVRFRIGNVDHMMLSNSGNFGIGTTTPSAQLHLADVYPAGGMNLLLGDDTWLSDIDVANTVGLYGMQNNDRAGIRFGSTGPTLFGLNNAFGMGTTAPAGQTVLHVYESGSSTSTWRGRIVASGASQAVVLGEFAGKSVMGAHNSALNAWTDLHLQFHGGNLAIGTLTGSGKFDTKWNSKSHVVFGTSTLANANELYAQFDWNESSKNFSISANEHGVGFRPIVLNAEGGNIGIGTTAPAAKLDVNGSIHISGGGTASPPAGLGYGMFPHSNVGIGTYSVHGGISFWGGATPTEYMRITNGNVGIGTTTPDAKLSVKGQVHAQEVKVDLNGAVAPDYVFNKDYKLPSLEEIKSYIEKNNHLPEVPSAKEMEANGMNLGEMNLMLLKKVEELTLYVLEQQRQIKELQTTVYSTGK